MSIEKYSILSTEKPTFSKFTSLIYSTNSPYQYPVELGSKINIMTLVNQKKIFFFA